jgi:hypothetical protein
MRSPGFPSDTKLLQDGRKVPAGVVVSVHRVGEANGPDAPSTLVGRTDLPEVRWREDLPDEAGSTVIRSYHERIAAVITELVDETEFEAVYVDVFENAKAVVNGGVIRTS